VSLATVVLKREPRPHVLWSNLPPFQGIRIRVVIVAITDRLIEHKLTAWIILVLEAVHGLQHRPMLFMQERLPWLHGKAAGRAPVAAHQCRLLAHGGTNRTLPHM
jgi:hypothetical protein